MLLLTLLRLLALPRPALIAENLFLRKQLALFRERNVKSNPLDRIFKEMRDVPFKEAVLPKFLYENAKKLLKL